MADVSGGSGGPDERGPGSSGPRDGQPTRRSFTAAYKLRIVSEYDGLTERGARGALLRREGLYQSHIDKWRRARDKGVLAGSGRSGGPVGVTAGKESAENRRLVAENARLAADLAKTRAVLEVMGKAHALLEILSEGADGPSTSTL